MGIVPDSSVWRDNESFKRQQSLDTAINIGIVRTANFNKITQEITYIVEVQRDGDKLVVPCRVATRFGGIYNYEEYTYQTYNFDENSDELAAFETKAGDTVLVSFLNGDPREGIIIGSIHHPGRKRQLPLEEGVQFKSSVNGVEQLINADGEYTVTFRGQPTNASILEEKPATDELAEPEYDDEIGTTYMKFDVDGGWTISDNATEDPQMIHINKSEGTTTITSGAIVLTMTKSDESTSLTTKTLTVEAADKMETKTKEWATEATTSAKLKSPKIAIGTDGTELLDELVKLIDAVGTQTIITPVGPASPVSASPQWAQVEAIKQKINGIKGSL